MAARFETEDKSCGRADCPHVDQKDKEETNRSRLTVTCGTSQRRVTLILHFRLRIAEAAEAACKVLA